MDFTQPVTAYKEENINNSDKAFTRRSMQFLWVDAFFPWNYTYYTVQNNTRIKLEELFTTQMVKNKLYCGEKE